VPLAKLLILLEGPDLKLLNLVHYNLRCIHYGKERDDSCHQTMGELEYLQNFHYYFSQRKILNELQPFCSQSLTSFHHQDDSASF